MDFSFESGISFLSASTDPSVLVEPNPTDVIHDLEKLDKERKVEWEALFNKYETDKSQNLSIDVEDLSNIFNQSVSSTASKVNKSEISKKSRNIFRNRNKTSSTIAMAPPFSFLYKWTKPAEIGKIGREFALHQINLVNLTILVEKNLHSDLKHLLVFHEEARYLHDRNFVKLHHYVQEELKRLHNYLENKYIVMYILLHKCDISLDQIIHRIENEHQGKLAECFSLASYTKGINPRKKCFLHQKFLREWNRLLQCVTSDYLVAYCNWIEMKLLKLKAKKRNLNIVPRRLFLSPSRKDG